MFGKGLYFADCPLKSLQYSSLPLGLGFFGCGQRYMLLCAVELGTTKVKTTASNHLDPDRDLRPPLLQRALLGRRDFDSVSARPKSWFGFGLRAPEYVVYDARQPIWLKMPSVLPEDSAPSALLGPSGGPGRAYAPQSAARASRKLATAAGARLSPPQGRGTAPLSTPRQARPLYLLAVAQVAKEADEAVSANPRSRRQRKEDALAQLAAAAALVRAQREQAGCPQAACAAPGAAAASAPAAACSRGAGRERRWTPRLFGRARREGTAVLV